MATRDYMSPSRAADISLVAGLLLIVGGGFQCIEAVAAIVKDEYLVVTPNYIYTFDLAAWGWIHLLGGMVLFAGVTGHVAATGSVAFARMALDSPAHWLILAGFLVNAGAEYEPPFVRVEGREIPDWLEPLLPHVGP